MKNRARWLTLFLGIFMSLTCLCRSHELTATELGRLEQGNIIIKNKKIAGAPWPELTYFYIIKASPEECAAILSNYSLQKNFTPDLTRVEIKKEISPTHKIVTFCTDLPWPAADDITVTDNQLSLSIEGDYRIEWKMVESTSSKKNHGSATFIPHGDITLYRYQTFVHPRSALAGMVKSRMIKKVKNAVFSFAAYVESLRAKNHPLLKKSIIQMRKALEWKGLREERSSPSGGEGESIIQTSFCKRPGRQPINRKFYTHDR